jgi:hypothetical protein
MNNILPILDEEIFYKNYNNNANDSKLVPIIITICRITCRLLKDDDPLVKKYNLDRAKMFKDFAHQIETNFDMDFLNPNIGTIQVLLLNAANTEKWTVESSDWICTSVAVKMVKNL